ncbi:MAG: Wzz/FepE/Etk N-terminal domain-containing protein [Caldibacillus sp.]
MEEETISLQEVFEIIRKKIALILIITFSAAAISAIVSFFLITPKYERSTQLLVNRSQVSENFSTNEVQTNIQLINTYSEIILSPRILDIAAKELEGLIDLENGEITASYLKGKITVNNQNNSQVLNISVEDTDPHRAALIANKVAEVFQREIPSIMNVDNVNILSEADVPEDLSPVSPKPLLNIAIAFVVGLMLGVGLAFLIEYFDNTIKTEQDIEKYLELPVLGVITTFDMEDMQQKRDFKSLRGERRVKHG